MVFIQYYTVVLLDLATIDTLSHMYLHPLRGLLFISAQSKFTPLMQYFTGRHKNNKSRRLTNHCTTAAQYPFPRQLVQDQYQTGKHQILSHLKTT